MPLRSLLVALLAIAACGVEPNEAQRSPLPIDATAQNVLDGAREAMANVTSYTWVSDVEVDEHSTGNVTRTHVEGFWMAPDDFQFIATYEFEGTIVIDHRWVDGRSFQKRAGVWTEMNFRDPVGVPRFQGHSEVAALENVRFSQALTSATWYGIQGEVTNHWESLGELGPLTSMVELSVRHDDLLLATSVVETALPGGGIYRQTTTFGRFDARGTIELPEGFVGLSDPNAPDPRPTPPL